MMECMWGVAPERVGGGFEAPNPFFKLIQGSRTRWPNAGLPPGSQGTMVVIDMKMLLIFIDDNT